MGFVEAARAIPRVFPIFLISRNSCGKSGAAKKRTAIRHGAAGLKGACLKGKGEGQLGAVQKVGAICITCINNTIITCIHTTIITCIDTPPSLVGGNVQLDMIPAKSALVDVIVEGLHSVANPFYPLTSILGGASSFCASKAPPYMEQLQKRQCRSATGWTGSEATKTRQFSRFRHRQSHTYLLYIFCYLNVGDDKIDQAQH